MDILLSTQMTIWLLPEEWATYLACNASTLLTVVITFEILCLTVPFLRNAGIDYVAHLGGYTMGILGGLLWKRDHGGDLYSGTPWGRRRFKEPRWYEKVLGR